MIDICPLQERDEIRAAIMATHRSEGGAHNFSPAAIAARKPLFARLLEIGPRCAEVMRERREARREYERNG